MIVCRLTKAAVEGEFMVLSQRWEITMKLIQNASSKHGQAIHANKNAFTDIVEHEQDLHE